MMDSKTWPQQAKLADIARKYGKEDKKNYEAYKAWLKDGIEPDEQDKDEKDRRPTALFWNLVSQFTPVIFRLDLNPERILGAVTLPVQLKYEGDGTWISAVEWENTAMDIHSGKKVETEIRPIQAASGKYELSIEPDPGVKEIHLTVRAHIHGRSIEIYDPTSRVEIYLSRDVIMVPIPPPTPKAKDDLTELEGIGQVTEKILNARGIITFQQLAETSTDDITTWLNNADLKMLDPKTWPQQAKLADLAKRYGGNDIKIYEAYKAWLKDGIEPDEYAEPEKGRRDAALVWNRISEFTPVIFSLALPSSGVHLNESIVLPIKLNRAEDQVSLSTVEWNVSSRSTPGGKEVKTTVNTIDAEKGAYELVIDPAQDPDAREIQVSIQACVNGRSIEIYYGKAITVQVSPIPGADPLEELEGIGEAMKKLLNEKGIYTFSQLANTDLATLNRWLNEKGYQRIDPKTWPQQAKLADVAYKYGRQEDRQSYEAYKAWLVRGIEPDEVDKDEKDRRPVARAWHIAPDSMPDPLEELEGIGKDVAQVLHDKGIFTFKQLAKADIKKISAWLNECGYERMDPKTWPQQAKLTGIAKEFGMEEDRRSYEAYKAWLKGGIEPDEYLKDEQDRRPVALTWHGTAELTEKAYPEIFG